MICDFGYMNNTKIVQKGLWLISTFLQQGQMKASGSKMALPQWGGGASLKHRNAYNILKNLNMVFIGHPEKDRNKLNH